MEVLSVQLDDTLALDLATFFQGVSDAEQAVTAAEASLREAGENLHHVAGRVLHTAKAKEGTKAAQVDAGFLEQLGGVRELYNRAVNQLADAEKYRFGTGRQSADRLEQWLREMNLDPARGQLDAEDLVVSRPGSNGMQGSWEDLVDIFMNQYVRSYSLRSNGQNSLRDTLIQAPIPIYGSPPERFEKAATNLAGSAWVGTVFTTYAMHGPVMAVVAGSSVFVIWFTAPTVKVARQATKNWAAKKLKVKKLEDI